MDEISKKLNELNERIEKVCIEHDAMRRREEILTTALFVCSIGGFLLGQYCHAKTKIKIWK